MDTTSSADVIDRQARIAEQLEQFPNAARIRRLEELGEPIVELRRLVGELDALPSTRRDDDLRDRVAETLRAFEDKRVRLRILTEARAELAEQLAEVERDIAGDVAIPRIKTRYERIIAEAGGVRQRAHNWEQVEIDEIERMEDEAEAARQKFLNEHDIPTTRQEGEEVVSVIVQFATLAKKDPDRPVTYFSEGVLGSLPLRMEVSRALVNARDILFALWDEKIKVYLDNARKLLEEEHQPRAARAELERCNQLPGRANPVVDVHLAEDQTDRIEEVRADIEEAIAKLDAAEDELRKARNALEPPAPNAIVAADHHRSAARHYPYVPGLDAVWARIVQVAAAELADQPDGQLPGLLQVVTLHLQQEQWNAAEAALTRARALLDMQPANEFTAERARYGTLNAVYDDVKPLLAGRLTHEEEARILDELQHRYGADYWPQWKALGRRLLRLQTRRNLDALIEEARAVGKNSATAADLVDLSERLAELQARPPADAPPDRLRELPGLIRRVNAWRGYAQLRDELAKAPNDAGVEVTSLDDLDLEQVADLKVAADGLDLALQHASVVPVVRGQPNLEQQLKALQRDDRRAQAIYEAAEKSLTQPTALPNEALEQLLDEIERALAKPSSFRYDLLRLYQEARGRLIPLLEGGLRARLNKARPSYYDSLRESDIKAELDRLQKLWQPPTTLQRAELATEAELARTMARAHRIEREILEGVRSPKWEEARSAWETVRDQATDGSEMRQYAHRRSRLAHKQMFFKEAELANGAEARAEVLRSLTKDPVLSDDWEVWYRHGLAVFDDIRAAVDARQALDQNRAGLSRAQAGVETARQSIQRAYALLRAQDTTSTVADALGQARLLTDVVEQWDILLRSLTRIYEALGDEPPSHMACVRMTQAHQDTVDQLAEFPRPRSSGPDAAGWYDGLWQQVSSTAVTRLNTRLRALDGQPTHILDQLDVMLGLIVLAPGNTSVQTQLAGRAVNIQRTLQTLVQNTVGDYSGAKFAARSKKPLADDVFLERQIEEARRTADSLEDYAHTLQQANLTVVSIDPQLLNRWMQQVSDWVNKLEQLNDAIQNAQQLAQDGLADPRQFAKANHILHVGLPADTETAQTPPEFIHAGHPTYVWTVAEIKRDEERREKQETFQKQIVGLIGQEKQGVELALRWRRGGALNGTEQGMVRGLDTVVSTLHGQLIDMIDHEPDDRTLLQRGLVYQLPETPLQPNRSLRGAVNIERLIGEKLEQYRQVGRWLDKASAEVAWWQEEWLKQRGKIAALRDSGPDGLNQALRLCLLAQKGVDEAGPYGDKLALQPTVDALSPAGMVAALDPRPMDSHEDVLWYGLTEALSQERGALQQQVEALLQNNRALEQDIRERLRQFPQRFQELMERKDELMASFKSPWRKWAETPAWLAFYEAAQAFCQICPQMAEYKQAVQEVSAYTRTTIYCPPDGEAGGGR